MLSSVAEKLYWFARYMERTSCTAELLNAYTQFVLDSALTSPPHWDVLIHISDGEEDYLSRNNDYLQDSVLNYMIRDRENPSSLTNSIYLARENIRTTRSQFPVECWELCNTLKITLDRMEGRYRFGNFDKLLTLTYECTGIIQNSMCHDDAYSFLRMGRYLERADMISRTIDTFILTAIAQEDDFDATLWLWPNLLKAIQAQSAFRRLSRSPLVAIEDVHAAIRFLFTERSFPRSLLFATRVVRQEITRLEKDNKIVKKLNKISNMLINTNPEKIGLKKIHQKIDKFQEELAKVHDAIGERWFN